MLHHQKALDGNGKLERGLADHVDVPTDFDTWLWATQLNQARAVRTGVEHFRSLRGTCMGTIWWQLNDCWPVTSWAVVDGAGRRKPAWFALRDAYAPRLLTIQPRGDELVLFAVNDSADEWLLDGAVTRWTFDGAAIAEAASAVARGAVVDRRMDSANRRRPSRRCRPARCCGLLPMAPRHGGGSPPIASCGIPLRRGGSSSSSRSQQERCGSRSRHRHSCVISR